MSMLGLSHQQTWWIPCILIRFPLLLILPLITTVGRVVNRQSGSPHWIDQSHWLIPIPYQAGELGTNTSFLAGQHGGRIENCWSRIHPVHITRFIIPPTLLFPGINIYLQQVVPARSPCRYKCLSQGNNRILHLPLYLGILLFTRY